jgi:predicted regulator of Ras-like GTPase activity (Roadblock/LC7/MglB family)
MVSPVDAVSALADLTEIASQVRGAVVLGGDGTVVASTGHAEPERLAAAGTALWEAAGSTARGRTISQLEVAVREGSVFVVRNGSYGIVATTGPGPSSALVFHDLRSCLASLDEGPARKRRRKSTADA